MNILKCFVSFVFLLLSVEFNSATDCDDYKTQSEEMFKVLVKYEAKIKQLESTIKNLTANAGALEKCAEPSGITKEELKKLQAKIRQQETEIRELKPKNNEQQQLAKSSSRKCDESSGTTTDRFDKLINKFTDELKREFKEQLASEISKLQQQQHSHQQVNIIKQNSTINKLKAAPNEQELAKDKQKGRTDLKVQNGINPAEATSCLAFGNSNDIQTIRVPGVEAFQVPCDSKIAGNGWTVIQRRVDDSVSFNRNWDEYRNGFGDLRGNFWLGLEKLHLMTKFQPHELYIQIEDIKNEKRYARYSNFSVGNEAQSDELLSVGEYDGNAGNALDTEDDYLTSKNMKFSTPDRDNDKANINCADLYESSWWFNSCSWCNPNGVYVNTITDEYPIQAMKWLPRHDIPLKFVQMMIRPIIN